MNLADAVYRTVHEYPGGATALAARMGMSSNMLSNKVNPNNDTHHLRLDEANTLMSFTNDYRILHAQAETHSKVCNLSSMKYFSFLASFGKLAYLDLSNKPL